MSKDSALRALACLALFALAVVLQAGCGAPVVGSGTSVTKAYDFAGFTRVEVGHAFEVQITRGPEFVVEVEIDDNLVDHLRVEQTGDLVRIDLDNTITFGAATWKATIVMPALEGVTLSGATTCVVRGFESAGDLAGEISGASSLTFVDMAVGSVSLEVSGASKVTGQLRAGEARFEASGASRVELAGSADDADFEASGASRLELSGLALQTADVRLSGASGGVVGASRQLSVDLSGASKLSYAGNPTIREIAVSGASTLERRD